MNPRQHGNVVWVAELLPHIQLTDYQIERLELIRTHAGVSDAEFHLHIQGHPECTKMLQRHVYEQMKREEPGASDEHLLVWIIYLRFITARMTGDDLFGLSRIPVDDFDNPPPEMVAAILSFLRTRGFRTIDDVAQAIVEEEAKLPTNVPPAPEFAEVARQVTLILAERSHGVGTAASAPR
jgi:hypothetical protein